MLPVVEIFGPTIQGEGGQTGVPTLFLRLGGCDYRCTWCDTLFAVLPKYKKEWLLKDEDWIIDQFNKLQAPPFWVTVSGGNPALHDLSFLLTEGRKVGYKFALETQGTKRPEWMAKLDHLTISPKPPSSEYVTPAVDVARLASVTWHIPKTIKVVVADRKDYEYAKEIKVYLKHFDNMSFFITPVTPVNTPDEMSDAERVASIRDTTEQVIGWLAEDNLMDVRVIPQLHVLLWGMKRGV